jgi:hypothetical protein
MTRKLMAWLATAGALLFSAGLWAETGNDALFELQLTGYAGGGKGSSLLVTQLYAEKPLAIHDVSAFLVVHHDRDFSSAYVGLARMFGDLQLGLGVGSARYDNRNHAVLNPWLFYAGEAAEIFLSAEHYGDEDDAPWFYKGQASRRFAGSLFAGVHGEKDVGVGPLFGWRNGNIRLWGAIPVVGRPHDGPRGIAGIQLEF